MTKTCKFKGCKTASGDGDYCADHEKTAKGGQEKKSSLIKAAWDHRLGSTMADSFLDEMEKIGIHQTPRRPLPPGNKAERQKYYRDELVRLKRRVKRGPPSPRSKGSLLLPLLATGVGGLAGYAVGRRRRSQEKTAIIADLIGYPMGQKAEQEGKERMMPAWAKVLFVPGGIGHEIGRWSVSKKRKGKEKKSAVSSVHYSKYFRHKLHERGITSPTQLSDAEKKRFFDKVDKGYHSKSEKVRGEDHGDQD